MTVPSSITNALASLQSQVSAAQPLANASQATRTALKLNAAALVENIQAALTETSILDTWVATIDPAAMVTGVLNAVTAGDDQNTLCLMRGICGRAASNLDQLP